MDPVECLYQCSTRSHETRRCRPGPLRLAGMMFGMYVLGSCGSPEGTATPVVDYEGPVAEVPVQLDERAGILDAIEASDFLVAPDATLHVVWRAQTKAPEGPREMTDRLYYRAGAELGARWGRLTELDAVRGGAVRIVEHAGTLHVIAGPALRHFVSSDQGASWRELTPLLSDVMTPSVAFETLATAHGLFVATLSRSPRRGQVRHADAETRLDLLEWRAPGRIAPRLTLSLPASLSDPPAPSLVVLGQRAALAVAINGALRETVQTPQGPVEQVQARAQIHYLESSDEGATWSVPAMVLPPPISQARAGPSRIDALAISVTGPERLLLFSGYGIFAMRSADGRRWSTPSALADYATRFSEGTAESGPLALAPGPRDGQALAWIDARFRKSDRRWWNPLGGFPWSDDSPYWRNNDVFIARLPNAGTAGAGDALQPRRITRAPAYARTLALQALPNRLILLWAGRPRVGRTLDSFGASPALYYTVINIDK